jgi:hypothetical protein
MDCGYSTSGVEGSIAWSGKWTWPARGSLTAVESAKITWSDLTWPPDVPGYDSGSSDSTWNSHLAGAHYPNFGASFSNIAPCHGPCHGAFLCDPQGTALAG